MIYRRYSWKLLTNTKLLLDDNHPKNSIHLHLGTASTMECTLMSRLTTLCSMDSSYLLSLQKFNLLNNLIQQSRVAMNIYNMRTVQ